MSLRAMIHAGSQPAPRSRDESTHAPFSRPARAHRPWPAATANRPYSLGGFAAGDNHPGHYFSRPTGFDKMPRPSISTSIRSPTRKKTGGCRAIPTPSGVPVRITVPGSNVNWWER
jgi:hypothetical protein